MSENINIKILIAPLDWGLGHATRCVPLITHLCKLGCKVIIAADGAQEKLLKTEFPDLIFVDLPGYRIHYSNHKRFFSTKIIFQLPKILLAIRNEQRWLRKFISATPVDAVISDNRFGLHVSSVPSVFITHQLLIKGPFTIAEKIMQKINYYFIEKFSSCWVPDEKGKVNIAGALSHPKRMPAIPVHYIGGLSRLSKQIYRQPKYELTIIISGPEPQRSVFEEKMMAELKSFNGTVLLVRGLPANEEMLPAKENMTIKNHLPAQELAAEFGKSELIISRSGYTTVMDILKLEKKAVFIPTPGQTEQEYLAAHLEEQGWGVTVAQEDFSLNELLRRVKNFEYKLPQLSMESYKSVVTDFVSSINA